MQSHPLLTVRPKACWGEAKDDLRSRRDTIFADKFFKLILAPDSPGDVDDVADSVALCLIDFDEDTVKASIPAACSGCWRCEGQE